LECISQDLHFALFLAFSSFEKKMFKIKVLPLSTFLLILDCNPSTAKYIPSEKDEIMDVISYIN